MRMKDKFLSELCNISNYAGMREDLVQAGGGNSSVKISDCEMLIKSSGYALSEVNKNKGYSVVNYKKAMEFVKGLETKYSEQEILDKILCSGEKPSIEVFLHAMMNKCTLHTHPIAVGVIVSRKSWKTELEKLFPEALFVEYATPGMELARLCYTQIKEKKVKVVFLQNHGLIISGETAMEVLQETENVIQKMEQYLGSKRWNEMETIELAGKFKACIPDFEQSVYLTRDERIYSILKENRYFCADLAVSPDMVVYCGEKMLCLGQEHIEEDIKEFYEIYGMPATVLFNGHVYIIAENKKKASEIESLLAFGMEIVQFNQKQELNMLSNAERKFLHGWEAEKYRRNKG